MAAFTTWLEAAPRSLLPSGGAPELFLPLINDAWQRSETTTVFHVLLTHPSASAWAELGGELLGHLLEPGCDTGICLDGEWPATTILRWLRETDEQDSPSVVDLQWLRSRHPVPHPARPQTTQNVRWLSFHRGVPRWLWSVWTQVDSDWFHVGRDLMVVALPAGAMADPRWDEPATIPSFGQSLRHGTGWIIPLDSNRGFALGVRRGTPLDAMLARPG